MARPRSTKAGLEFSDHEVTKTFLYERDARLESRKLSEGLRVARESGLFRVPAVRVQEARSIVMERIGIIGPLYSLLNTDTGAELCQRAGAVLAVIHEQMTLEEEYRSTIAPPFDQPEPVFIHGDYNSINVQYDSDQCTLVVLDWNTPYWAGSPASIGSRYWDIAIFLMHLFNQRIGSSELVNKPEALAGRFLAGYESERPIDRVILREYATKVLNHRVRAVAKSIPHRIARAPYLFRYKQFLRRISRQ